MKLTHIRGIDSIRSIGAVLVLIYHLFTNILPGGFFGVDIFFVISGFLVTSLFLKEQKETGRIDIIGFYVRRVRRLLPAVAFMVVCTLALVLLISPDLRVGMRTQTAAVFGWMTNYFEILTGGSYEEQFLPHFFVHTWTLGVEMQYYLIWGAVFGVFILVYRRVVAKIEELNRFVYGMNRAIIPQNSVAVLICVAIAVFSYVRMQLHFVPLEDPSPIYYATSTRIYPLMIGSALGALTGMRVPKKRLPALVSLAVLILSMFAIVWMAMKFSFSDERTYRYGILLVSLLTAVSIYCILCLQLKKFFGDIKPMAFLGKRAFSIYLFHWPLYHIFRQWGISGAGPFPEGTPQPIYAALAITATLCFAELSYRIFEQRPIGAKHTGDEPWKMNRLMRATLIGFCVCIAFSIVNLTATPARTSIESDYRHQQVLLNIGKMGVYDDYLSALQMNPVALHGKPDLLPLTPSEQAAALDIGNDAATTQQNAQEALNRPDPAGPIAPIAPPGGANVTVIGDSVTLGAADIIQQTLGSAVVDAVESRNMGSGAEIINDYVSRGELGEYVVIALFTNVQYFTESATNDTFAAIPPGHKVIAVTPFGKDYMEECAEMVRRLPQWYDYCTVADWNTAIREHTDLLAPDGLHMNGDDSKQIYANLIAQAIEQASKKPAKK